MLKQKENIIQLINSSCKDCCFAEYNGITQTGCSLGQLDKYRKLGVEIIEAYDDYKEFFVVNNRRCIYSRNEKWLNKHKESIDSQLKKEIDIPYQLLLVASNDLDELEKYIEHILNTNINKPRIITIIRKIDNLRKPSEIKSLLVNKSIKRWSIRNFVIEQNNDGIYKEVITSLSFPYCLYITNLKSLVPEKCIDNVQNKIYDELFQFSILKENDNYFISNAFHSILGSISAIEKETNDWIYNFRCQKQ